MIFYRSSFLFILFISLSCSLLEKKTLIRTSKKLKEYKFTLTIKHKIRVEKKLFVKAKAALLGCKSKHRIYQEVETKFLNRKSYGTNHGLPREFVDYIPLTPYRPLPDKDLIDIEFWSTQTDDKPMQCTFTLFEKTNYFDYEELDAKKYTTQNPRILGLGASIFVNNRGTHPFPYILNLYGDQKKKNFTFINLSVPGATIFDHIHNWDETQRRNADGFWKFQMWGIAKHMRNMYETDKFRNQQKHYEFGAKEYNPDAIIYGNMWNDLNTRYFYKVWAKKEKYNIHMESRMYFENFYQKKYDFNVVTIDNNTTFEYLMYKVLYDFTKIFIDKAPKDKPFFLVSLPFAYQKTFSKSVLRHLKKNFFKDHCYEPFSIDKCIEFYQIVEKTYVRVYDDLARDYSNVYFIDLGLKFQEDFHGVSLKKYLQNGIMIMDGIHFNINGSEYIAMSLWKELMHNKTFRDLLD